MSSSIHTRKTLPQQITVITRRLSLSRFRRKIQEDACPLSDLASNSMHCLRIGLTSLALFQFSLGGPLASHRTSPEPSNDGNTTTPIKHVIVIIGENRSFDHVFATYVPKPGQKVWNLLSEGIVKADGTPGPNFDKAHQLAAVDLGEKNGGDPFLLSSSQARFRWRCASLLHSSAARRIPTSPATASVSPKRLKPACPASYYPFLVSGGTGLTSHTPDTRITNVNALPAGPFQLTNGKLFGYNAYAASPVHRFYQMWQQLDCCREHIAGRKRDPVATANCSPGSKSLSAPAPTA